VRVTESIFGSSSMTPESPTAAENNRWLYHHGAMTTCLALRPQVENRNLILTAGLEQAHAGVVVAVSFPA